MNCAYDKCFMSDAQELLASMLDYAVNSLHYAPDFFYEMFLQSSYEKRVTMGEATVISGMSGIELARRIVEEKEGSFVDAPGDAPGLCSEGRSPQYWCGWAMAYYQWYCGSSFVDIDREVPFSTVIEMYNPYHEMDVSHFAEAMDEMRRAKRLTSYLKQYRMARGLTQAKLAEESDIPKKTIQQYEQRQKNINKAQVDYLVRLSKVLQCNIEDLLE